MATSLPCSSDRLSRARARHEIGREGRGEGFVPVWHRPPCHRSVTRRSGAGSRPSHPIYTCQSPLMSANTAGRAPAAPPPAPPLALPAGSYGTPQNMRPPPWQYPGAAECHTSRSETRPTQRSTVKVTVVCHLVAHCNWEVCVCETTDLGTTSCFRDSIDTRRRTSVSCFTFADL